MSVIDADTDRDLAPKLGGSFMRATIEAFDWSKTPLGPMQTWPEPVRTCMRLMLASTTPIAMLVGPQGILLFNDGYAQFAGPRYEKLIGKPAVEAWPEIADFNRDNLRRLQGGETFRYDAINLKLDRTGELSDVWLDLDYTPIIDDRGEALGGFALVTDVTERILAEQRLEASRETLAFASSAADVAGNWDWRVQDDVVTADRRFAELYGVDPVEAARGVPIARFIDGVHPDDRPILGAAIEQAMKTLEPLRCEYRVRDNTGTERWVLAFGQAFVGADGTVARLPGITLDISDRKATEVALAESEAKFRAIADAMPQMVWSALPDGLHDYYNARWYEFTGMAEGSTDGEGWNGMFHPEDRERAWETWRHSLQTGEVYEIEYRLRHHSGQYRWTLGRALPILDQDGRIIRWFGTCTDIHETKLAAVEREVVAQELSHRIKNIFSVLTGLVSLSGREHPELAPVVSELRARITALGKAHDHVRPHSTSSRPQTLQTSFHSIIRELMAPYARADGVNLHGEDVAIDDKAATPLALLFHELATNAAKYGALSRHDGTIDIQTQREGEDLRIDWIERGGPDAAEVGKQEGFGTRLISLSVEGQMGGSVERRWRSEGLEMTIRVPAKNLTRSGDAGAL